MLGFAQVNCIRNPSDVGSYFRTMYSNFMALNNAKMDSCFIVILELSQLGGCSNKSSSLEVQNWPKNDIQLSKNRHIPNVQPYFQTVARFWWFFKGLGPFCR